MPIGAELDVPVAGVESSETEGRECEGLRLAEEARELCKPRREGRTLLVPENLSAIGVAVTVAVAVGRATSTPACDIDVSLWSGCSVGTGKFSMSGAGEVGVESLNRGSGSIGDRGSSTRGGSASTIDETGVCGRSTTAGDIADFAEPAVNSLVKLGLLPIRLALAPTGESVRSGNCAARLCPVGC